MLELLEAKVGPHGSTKLVGPEVLKRPVLDIEGAELEVVEFGEGESKHIAAVYVPRLRALLSGDLVYNQAHLYLQERHLESWLGQLDRLEAYAAQRVTTIYPGHGKAAGIELIEQTRAYLRYFAEAVKSGKDAFGVEQWILSKYPDYHVRQFLTAFSIPAYFPAPDVASKP